MSSILYLWVRSIKNWFLGLWKKPWLLVLYLLVIALIAGMVISSRAIEATYGAASSFPLLKLILFSLFTSFMLFGVYKGLSKGGSFFDMSDVNLLFVSPVNPRIILMHGILRQVRTALFIGFFILFQAPNLKSNFGLEFSAILIIFAAFALVIISSETLAMFIYSKTNGNKKRQNTVKIIAVLLFLPAASYYLSAVLTGRDALSAAYDLSLAGYIDFIPITGWMAKGCLDTLAGDITAGAAFIAVTVIFDAALIILITAGKIDYYEDVLCATESAFEKRRAAAEGNMSGISSTKKVKVARTGLSGAGAGVFFSKHIRESQRGSVLGIMSLSSLIIIGIALFIALISREGGSLIPILQVVMWMQIFMIGTGNGLKELTSHYIYMIPASPVKKLLWSNSENMLKSCIEAAIALTGAGLILKADFLTGVCCLLAYTFFTSLLLSINYVTMRIFEAPANRGLLMLVYILFVMLIMTPGIVAAVLIGSLTTAVIGLLLLSLWEAVAALILFYLSKGVIHNCDMVTIKM